MKLSVFLLLVICFQSSAESYSQNVTLSERNAPLEKVFKSIKKQTDYVFFFDYSWLDQAKPVNINVKNLPLEQALNLCFKNQPLTYAVVGKTVVIKPKIMSVQDSVSKVSGTVTDAQGAPLIGVSVKIREKADAGVTTDHNGKYSVSVLDQQTLIFSYIGFKTQSVAINGRIVINVVLKEDLAELNEVVVIGYGSTTKKDLTGSVGQVQMADIAKAPVFTFTDALAGRVAGVQVSSNDGQPGSQQNIVIRGSGSLTQNTDPLYVIDGFAIESFDSNSLNPSDIESITILKDASSTAVYGSRGSNGVIVVQTKKGKIGKPVVTFNTSLGIQELRKQMELLSPYEFVKTQTEMANPAIAAEVYFKNGKTLDSYKNVEGINWQDLIFRQGVMQNYNMAVRGGSEQTKYSISGTLNDQDAVMINSGYNRYVGRVSLDQNISEKIKIGMNANYSNASSYGVAAATNTGTSSVSNYLFANVYGYRPIDADGNLGLIEDLLDPDMPVGVNTVRINPVITAENTHRISRTTDLTANGYFEYAFNKDLTLNVRAGSRRRIIRSEAFYNSLTPRGAVTPANPNGANGNIAFAENNTWNNDNTLTYNKTFNKDHKLTVLGGFSLEGVNTNTYGATAQHLPNEQLGLFGLDEGTPSSVSASGGESTLMSFFNRIDYNYKSRYMLSFTMRADGSSKFSEGRRWGYFPAAAVAWNMSEENFMKSLPYVSNSKIRLSYGANGNNRIGYYDIYNRISFDNAANGVSYNNQFPVTSARLSELGNANLQWESTAVTNLAYDLGLFNNRLELTAEAYRRTTNNLLLDAEIPYFTGYANTVKNIGKLKNEGLEFTLNTINIKSPSFTWQSNFNISFNKSKILELTESNTLFSNVSGGFSPAPNLWAATVGQPVSVFHGYVFDGVYQYADFDNPQPGVYLLKPSITTNGDTRGTIKPGDIKYKDLNGDLAVNAFDQTIIGRAEPVHTGGFSNNFSYKGLSLNVFFQWSYGNDIFNGNRLVFEGNSQYSYHTNQFATWANRWTPENPSNEYFRVGGEGPTAFGSSRVIEDGSYLRLKTVSLGYQIPSKFIKKLYLKSLSVNASAQNLATWTNYSGLDPEVSVKNSALTQGFDYSAYPHAQTMVFGINATF